MTDKVRCSLKEDGVAKKSKLTAAKPVKARKAPRMAGNHNELLVR